MSSSDRTPGGPSQREDASATPPAGNRDIYGNWLDRMQRARARHATITKNLQSWSNYKSWAEQVKGSWDDEPPQK